MCRLPDPAGLESERIAKDGVAVEIKNPLTDNTPNGPRFRARPSPHLGQNNCRRQRARLSDLLNLITEQADDETVFPPERWAATSRSHAQLIHHELGDYLGYSPLPPLKRLIEDA